MKKPLSHSLDLNKNYPTLGEYFTDLGYATGAFSSNSAWITPEYLGRGFLRFDVYSLEDHLRRTTNGRKLDRISEFLGLHYAGRGRKAPDVSKQFFDFVDDYRERPFFGYICYMDVNREFHNTKLNRGIWEDKAGVDEIVTSYDNALNVLDSQIADLLSEMENRGILQNTLVIITSDHGESFGSESAADHDPDGHGTSLYPEQTRVPLFVVFPDRVPAGQIVTQPVGLETIPAVTLSGKTRLVLMKS